MSRFTSPLNVSNKGSCYHPYVEIPSKAFTFTMDADESYDEQCRQTEALFIQTTQVG